MSRHVRAVTMGIMAVSVFTGAIAAEARVGATRNFDIPAGDMANSLRIYGIQADEQIIFDAVQVRHFASAPVKGQFEGERALKILLKGTPLAVTRAPGGVLMVAPRRVAAPATRSIALAQAANSLPAPDSAAGSPMEAVAPALEEIVVTAQKRTESLQDTPISISVISGEQMSARGLTGIESFAAGSIPSLRVSPIIGRTSAFNIGIRGVVPNDASQVTRDPTLGIYIDGVYLGRVQGLGIDFLDVERIEVLKGPQGTLFGRNAVAGAISIVSKKPTGEFEGEFKVGARNFDGQNIRADVNLPAIGNVSIKLGGAYSKRDGWVENPLAGASDFSAYKKWGIRAAVLWEPVDNLSFLYNFDKSKDKTANNYGQIDRLLPGAPPLAPFFSIEPNRVRRARGGFPLEPSVGDVSGHSLNGSWDVAEDIEIRSITSYRKLDQTQYDNFAGTFFAYVPGAAFGRVSLAETHQNQFSQELQLVGSLPRLDYVLGAYYYREKAHDSADTPTCCTFNADGSGYTVLPALRFGARPVRASRVRATSHALFGQATWTPPVLSDRLHATVGARLTHDEKSGGMIAIRGVPSTLTFDFKSTRVDPAVTLAYDWTDDINTYVKWGTAYRAGGANTRTPNLAPFGEEELETAEIGLKSELFDRRLRANLAAYKSIYRDLQIDVTSPVNPALTETVNAIRPVKIWGFEADFTLAPARGLTLNAGYAYTNVDIPLQPSPFTTQIIVLNVVQTPKQAFSVSGDWDVAPVGAGMLALHMDGSYSSRFFSDAIDYTSNPGYFLLNGRVAINDFRIGDGGKQASVAFWMKNITDKAYYYYDFPLAGTGLANTVVAYYNEPRTYGLDFTFRF